MRPTSTPRRNLALALEFARESRDIPQQDVWKVINEIAKRMNARRSDGTLCTISYSGWRNWTRPRACSPVWEWEVRGRGTVTFVGTEEDARVAAPKGATITQVGEAEEPWGVDVQYFMPVIANFCGVEEPQMWAIARGLAVLNPISLLVEDLARSMDPTVVMEGDRALLEKQRILHQLRQIVERTEAFDPAEALAKIQGALADVERETTRYRAREARRITELDGRVKGVEGITVELKGVLDDLKGVLDTRTAPRRSVGTRS